VCLRVGGVPGHQAVCGVREYPCLFAEMRRVKNNKELPSFDMFGGCHFAPCLFRGKGRREKTIEN